MIDKLTEPEIRGVSFRIDAELLARIDAVCDRVPCTRTRFIVTAAEAFLEEAERNLADLVA